MNRLPSVFESALSPLGAGLVTGALVNTSGLNLICDNASKYNACSSAYDINTHGMHQVAVGHGEVCEDEHGCVPL